MLTMSGGRKIYTIFQTESPYEVGEFIRAEGVNIRRLPKSSRDHIANVLVNCNWSASSMSRILNVGTSTINKWVRGSRPPQETTGTLYILLDRTQQAFKVGITHRDVKTRVAELQTSCSSNLQVAINWSCNSPRGVENTIHTLLKGKGLHLKREWFKDTVEFRRYLGALSRWKGDPWLRENPSSRIKHEWLWEDGNTPLTKQQTIDNLFLDYVL